MDAESTSDPIYLMGQSAEERERLIQQAGIFGPISERFLRTVGISPGMRVLDVGCGVGDVSMLCAWLTGPGGEVIGVDRDAAALARARERVDALGLQNVRFIEADYRELREMELVDAVVGRAVLMYAADPAAAIRALLPHLRPGRIVAFQEFDFTNLVAFPPVAIYEQIAEWWKQVTSKAGIERQMGYKLFPAFRAAGLPAPDMQADAVLGGGPDFVGYAYLADVFRSVLPLIEQFGIATAEEVAIDTLADRLRDEVVAGGGVLALQLVVGAAARKP